MQKFIRVMAVVAVALVGLSLLLLLVTIPFQRAIVTVLSGPGATHFVADALPQFPLIPFLTCLLRMVFMALLIVCCGNKKGGIWLELIVFICMVTVLPAFSWLVSLLYSHFLARLGDYHATAHSMISSIANFCMIPGNLAVAIAYVVCGMSISFKRMNKKLETGVI